MKHQIMLVISAILVVRATSRLIDLSHNHGPDTLMAPNNRQFYRNTTFAGDFVPGVYVENGEYFSGEHGGTHLDAPAHFQRGGQQLHQVPLENTIAEGVMIDCSAEAAANRSYMVPLGKLLEWERVHGQIPRQAAVLFNFGWSSKFDNPIIYLGAEFNFMFPTVGAEAGIWLYEYRDIKIIGTDTLSPDPLNFNENNPLPIHRRYLPNNRLIVENLKDTEQLPPKGFRFHASPVKYVGNTGAQVRAFAMTYDTHLNSGTPGRHTGLTCLLNCFFVLFLVSGVLNARSFIRSG